MSKYSFEHSGTLATDTETFAEATADELKLLVALLEKKSFDSVEQIASVAGISKPRCISAITLWKEAGVIKEVEESYYGNKLTDEFSTASLTELEEQSAKETAEVIRNKKLADLFVELAAMAGKPMLSPAEVKKVTALSSQYAVSEDYIAALAAHMSEESEFTVHKLVGRAMRLCERGVDTVEELEIYISDKERERSEFAELRRELGIRGRKLSKSESAYFKKWMHEYGFSVEIIGEAYDMTTLNIGRSDFRYMDKLVSDWYNEGCVTLADCLARSERVKSEMDSKFAKPVTQKVKKETPRFNDVDPEEALKKALSRSFPFETENKG